MRNIWFTSDWHLGHGNIIKLCNRPFKTVEEMDEAIIGNFNDTVKDGDMIYHLGDICLGNWNNYKDKIKHRLGFTNWCYIRGNHDSSTIIDRLKASIACNIYDYWEAFLLESKQMLVMSHYPFEDWNGRYKGSIHLHGHTHGQLQINKAKDMTEIRKGNHHVWQNSCEIKPIDTLIPNRFDVSVECTDYKPIHIDEILAKVVKV